MSDFNASPESGPGAGFELSFLMNPLTRDGVSRMPRMLQW